MSCPYKWVGFVGAAQSRTAPTVRTAAVYPKYPAPSPDVCCLRKPTLSFISLLRSRHREPSSRVVAARPSPSFASAPSSAPTPPHHRRLHMLSCMDLPCALPPSRGLRPRAFLGPQAHSPQRASQVRASAALYMPDVRYGGEYTTSQICDLPRVFSISEVRYGGDYT